MNTTALSESGNAVTPRFLVPVSRAVGVTYLVLCLATVMRSAYRYHGLPLSLVSSESASVWPAGATGGLKLTSLLTILLLGCALATRALTRLQWAFTGVVAVWLLAPSFSLLVVSGTFDKRLLAFAATGAGIAVAAALAGARITRWTLFWSGSVWALASLILGLTAALSGGRLVRTSLESDPGDRYTRWLRALGLDLGEGSVQALLGLSLHRQLLGMLLAMFLVLQVRHLMSVGANPRVLTLLVLLGPLSTGLALLWSMSRTSIVAAIVGLAASVLPIQRLPARRAIPLVSLAVVLIVTTPALLRGWIASSGDGTLAWRGALWDQLLDLPGFWSPLGLGPRASFPNGASHAHNQALEAISMGGWLGLVALVVLVVISAFVAVHAAQLDRRATFACLMTAAVISQFEILTPTSLSWQMNPGLVVLVGVVASSAGLVRSARPAIQDQAPTSDDPNGSHEGSLVIRDDHRAV